MHLHNFIVLPIVSVALAATSAYSSPTSLAVAPTQIIEEVEVMTEQEEIAEEVNPTQEEQEPRETAPERSAPVIVEANGNILYTQNEVRLYPVLESICTCESGKQFHADGTVVRGIVNPQDIGMCQINLKYHGDTAESLGYDVFTEEGNIRYTNWLYDQQGAQPWYLSRPCHGIG